MKTVDCRGLNCPEPVIKTKKALLDFPYENIEIKVDNETARENVLRFAGSQGRIADWQEIDDHYRINIDAPSGSESPDAPTKETSTGRNKPVLMITTNLLGQGSEELGAMLMRNFIYTLTEREDLPRAIILMNSGVKLSIKESSSIEELKALENRGVNILVCGTCLDYYQLKNDLETGQISNMYDISDMLFEAEKVLII